MRKYLLGFIGLFMAMGVVLSSCKRDNNPQNTQNLTENEKTATATEFATFEAKEENEFCNVKLTIDYPIKGEQVYLDSVRRWIDNTLCRDAFDWEGGKLKKYRGDWSDGEKLVKHYAKAQLKTDMDEEEKSFLREMEVSYECAHTADVTFEGEQVTSMYFSTYVYAGGAHGGILSESATFYNNNGKRVGWEIFKDTKKVKDYKVKVTAYELNVRKTAGDGQILRTLKKDDVVTISKICTYTKPTGSAGLWGYVKRLAGWISLAYTTKDV